MKQNLGKILFVWMITIGQLWGAYEWSVLETPAALVVGQSGVVRYQCRFDGSAANYTIEFKPKETDGYTASILTQRDQIIEGKRVQTFDVLIAPKRSGEMDVRFEVLMRHTTFASIENATIGRDNVKKYDFDDTQVFLPPVMIHAQENPVGLAAGTLTLEVRRDAKMVRAHEPLHLNVLVRGTGRLDQLVPFELNISGVKVFAEPPQKSLTPSPEGVEGEVSQEFALVAGESYTIEPLHLSYFDTEKNRVVTLASKPIYVEVGEGYEFSSLLDAPEINDYGTLKRYGLYLFFIGLGIGLNEGVRWLWKHRPRKQKKYFWEKSATKTELIQLLSLTGDKRYDEVIRLLEEGKVDLREAKKRLKVYPF
ncbi:MAG TPA: hypothetical protein VFX68_03385 [Sulfuricurvum sp.]|nr:hypothetical protein [Sulfuricurvum sp.]